MASYVVCEANSHANNLNGWKSESAPANWTFNKVTRGPWEEKWTNKVRVSTQNYYISNSNFLISQSLKIGY